MPDKKKERAIARLHAIEEARNLAGDLEEAFAGGGDGERRGRDSLRRRAADG